MKCTGWLACALAVIVITAVRAPASEVVLHNFGCPPRGAGPNGVIGDAAGNFYGTTFSGGAANLGVVYAVDLKGHQTVLHSFTGAPDGANPLGGVIRDSAGNLYGTTQSGGTANWGVVYKLDTAGHETVLYSFTGGSDGAYPYAGVIRDSAGNLYGTTYVGGTIGWGVVYKVDTTGHETVLHSFGDGPGDDGEFPRAGVILDPAGKLYGTTSSGGTGNYGVVYKLDTTGNFTALYSFTGFTDGNTPYAGVIRDSAGNLYGTTISGGTTGAGVVYKVDATGHETALYSFEGGSDGAEPYAGVILDSAGNLYGTTYNGGTAGAGVVYKLDAAGQEAVLYSFSGGSDGNPQSGVIRDASGNLYGTAAGELSPGVVYKLNNAGEQTIFYSFPAGTDGGYPTAGVIRDPSGNLYGTTGSGGTAGEGVVYKLDTTGQETVLYSFTGGADGSYPYAGVILDSAGNLYGTTQFGGTGNAGVVYRLDTSGHETVLYSFTGGADGGYPNAGVILDPAGNLYGTTWSGGNMNDGVVYKVDAARNEIVLYSFAGGADGADPYAGVIRDPAGNLYGTTQFGGDLDQGVVYKLDTTGHETVLHTFGGADGAHPKSGLIRDSAGNFYGTTFSGGTAEEGVVYKLDTAGHETVLYSVSGVMGEYAPSAGVIRDAEGNLYGRTEAEGLTGIVYKVDTNGNMTVLYSFTEGADGGGPLGGLIFDSVGDLYGTTCFGGKRGTGVIFKVTP
jgi:uncharacterized repeat protein (TIGR03803 family)